MIFMRTHDGLLPLTLALLMTGCPGDDSPMDTDADTDTEGTTGTTSTPTNPTDPTNPTNPTDSSTSSVDTTMSPDDTTDTGEDSTTEDPPPDGTCIGLDQVGDIGTVFSLDGAKIDTTCDPTPMPCGGDIVGTWNIESACGYDAIPNPLEQDCPGSTFTLEVVGQSGTLTFEDDGTFAQDFNIEVQAVFGLDTMACFMLACADFESIIQMDDPAASCVDAMGTCTCTFPPDPPGMAFNGTYEVMGNTVTLDVGGEQQELEFCVETDRLGLWNALLVTTPTEVMCEDETQCADELGDMHEGYFCAPPA